MGQQQPGMLCQTPGVFTNQDKFITTALTDVLHSSSELRREVREKEKRGELKDFSKTIQTEAFNVFIYLFILKQGKKSRWGKYFIPKHL